METETLSFAEDLCPKDIVTQLLEIAKAHDALDEIGGATSWRWQEGIISRMPKTKTVSKVLRKAFRSEEPREWYAKCSGDLQVFIKNTFMSDSRELDNFEPKDIYDAYCAFIISTGMGISFLELVNALCDLRFVKSNVEDDDFAFVLNHEVASSLYGEWAAKKVSDFLKIQDLKKGKDGLYRAPNYLHFCSDRLAEYLREIEALRFRVVGKTSVVDMYKSHFVALTDEEMIHIEKMFIKFNKELAEELKKIGLNTNRSNRDLLPRMLNMTTTTYPLRDFGGAI